MTIEAVGVCFDIDDTLAHDVNYRSQLRPGTIDLLERQRRAGRASIITTTGGGAHLQEVMSIPGVKELITSVFAGNEFNVGMGKLYRPAAASLGLSDTEAPHRMIATGDSWDDQPADLPIVFIFHPGGYQYDASLLDHLIQHLLKAGGNSFIDGFTRIMRDNRKPGSNDTGVGAMLDGISVTLSLRDPREGGKNLPRFTPGIRIPTISVVGAERYRRKMS